MKDIDPTRLDLAREFRDAPLGPHSAELQKLLSVMRWHPLKGKPILVCTQSGREWRLGRNPGKRGEPVAFEGEPFDDMGTTLWALFRARWEASTGRTLEL
ncbi:MAG: hypothetical protein HKP27_07150 [Myxococcales bacterium]|nr:hypothetical protein [Myxococcales bacterium]